LALIVVALLLHFMWWLLAIAAAIAALSQAFRPRAQSLYRLCADKSKVDAGLRDGPIV